MGKPAMNCAASRKSCGACYTMSEARNAPAAGAALPVSETRSIELVGSALRERLIRLMRLLLGVFDKHVGAHGPARIAAILFVYAVDLAAMFWVAYELRWDFSIPPEFAIQCLTLIFPVVACKLLLLESFGQFRSIMSYFGLADFVGVVLSMSIVSGCMLALWFEASIQASPPRGVILMDFVLSVGIIAASRLSLR